MKAGERLAAVLMWWLVVAVVLWGAVLVYVLANLPTPADCQHHRAPRPAPVAYPQPGASVTTNTVRMWRCSTAKEHVWDAQ